MEILISKIKNKNLYYGYVNPKYYYYSSAYGIYFKNDIFGFNLFTSFVNMLKDQYALENINISFDKEPLSIYDNDVIEQIDPPF